MNIDGALRCFLPSKTPPIIISSMGRSGSTLVFNAVRKGMAVHRFGFEMRRALRIVIDTAGRRGYAQNQDSVIEAMPTWQVIK